MTEYIKKLELKFVNCIREKVFKFKCSKDVYKSEIVKDELIEIDREKFLVFHLDGKNRVLNYEVVSVGSLNSSIVHPREAFKSAIKSNAASVIFVHNHPTGDPKPSSDDIAINKRLVEAGKILGIKVLDHIIVGDKQYFSFREENLL